MRKPAIVMFSFDDYHALNLRVADILEKYKLTGTFFLETATPESKDQAIELWKRGHIIGSHTLTHPSDMKAINLEEARTEVEASKRMIEDWTGDECLDFCYPRGRFNDDVVELVKRAGYKYARTTHVLKTETGDNPFKIPTTIHVYDGREEYKGRRWDDMANFIFDDVQKHGGYFHLWGHAREIDRDHQWERLETMIQRIALEIWS